MQKGIKKLNQTYNNIKKTAFNQDTNCCTVISASVVFEKDYDETYAFFKDRGRKNGKGLRTYLLEPILFELAELEGFKIELFTRHWNFDEDGNSRIISWESEDREETITYAKTDKSITLKNFRDYLPKGDYILGVRGHVVGVKNGVIQDWTANVYDRKTGKNRTSQKVLDRIYRIEKKNKVFKDLKSKYDFSKFI